jgi:tRNA (guanine-N7-)-methyltransferase
MDELFPCFGVEPGDEALDFEVLFGRRAPVVLDIGFGNGEALAEIAAAHPERDYLGIEVYRPGIGRLLRQLEAEGITNVRVACADGVAVLRHSVPTASLAGLQLFFPDPWPKKRHHKRRLIQPGFVAELARVLQPDGRLHLATDWEDYAEHMRAVLDAAPDFANTVADWAERPAYRPSTRFELRGERKGHSVFDLIYRRMPA